MKKFIAVLLLLAMCVSLFAACEQEPAETTGAVSELPSAKAYLFNMYKGEAGKDEANKIVKDMTVVSSVMIGGVSYGVEWSVEITAGAADAVTITDGENGAKVIDITEQPTEQVEFTLIGTVSDSEGNTESMSVKFYTPAVEAPPVTDVTVTAVTAPEAGKAYKMGMFQANLGQTLYITGNTANKEYYLETTEDVEAAIDVYLEEAEGGYKAYFTKDGVKTYIDVYYTDTGYVNIRLTDAPTAVFTWSAEYNTLVTSVAAGDVTEDYYMGTYNEYNTLSASKLSYAATSFPSTFYAVEGGVASVPQAAESPVAGTAYKFGMFQGNLTQTLYITGNTANKEYYLETTDDPSAAIDVYVEEVAGGYQMYFMAGDVKTYIDIYYTDTGYVNLRLTDAPTAVLVWNTEYMTFTASIAAGDVTEDYYMGTYNEYNTLSASKLSYAATSFPATLWTVGGSASSSGTPSAPVEDPEPTEPVVVEAQLPPVVEVAEGTAYKYGLIQVTTGNTVYITGEVSGRYLSTTADKAAAADVYVEAADGGYKIYIVVDGVNSYIDIYNNDEGKVSLQYSAEGDVFAFNAECGSWVTNLDGTDYYLGSYNDFETISASKTSYINVENAGISQYPAGFFTAE